MSVLVPFVLVPAGLAVAAGASGGTPASAPPPTNLAPNGGVNASSASTPGATIGDLLTGPPAIGSSTPYARARFGARLAQIAEASAVVSDRAQNSSPIDAEIQAKIDTIEAYGKAAYNKMTSGARKEGAQAMNKELNLDPPLDGSESFEDVMHRIAPAIGGTVGAAVGGALGGPAGAAIGAFCGKYLGVKYEELLAKAIPEIKDFFRSKWADIENWVSGAAHDAYDTVSGWFDDAF